MSLRLFALAIAFLSGVTMAFQGAMNARLGKVVGLWEATFIVHVTGTILVTGVVLLICGWPGGLARIGRGPWYTYLGGALGVLIIYTVARAIPRAGAAPATTAIIVGQVLTAVLVDHFGIFGLDRLAFTYTRILGLALLAGGAWLLLKR